MIAEVKKQPEEDVSQAQGAANPNPPCIKQEMSTGEKWYNRIVYQGINYWLNLGISLVITDFFMHGPGAKYFNSGVASSTKALTGLGLSKKNAKWISEIGLGTFSLNSGGNILLIPTKFIEDDKRGWVHWLNEKLGVDQTAPDGHKMTKDEIYIEEEQAPQSWGRMIARRAMGWGTTTSVGLLLDRYARQPLARPHMVDGEMEHFKPGQKVFTDGAVNITNSALRGMGAGRLADSPMFQRYLGYAALDTIYTAITSKILHLTNGAKKQTMPQEMVVKPAYTPEPAVDNGEDKPMPASKAVSKIIEGKKEESFAAAAAASKTETQYQLGA